MIVRNTICLFKNTHVMKKVMLLLIQTILLLPLSAQEDCNRWSFGANFTLFAPINEMQDYNFGTAYGGSFYGLYNMTPNLGLAQFHIGGRFRLGLTEARRNEVELSNPANALADRLIYNTLADLDLVLRANWAPGYRFQPYAEFFIGGRFTGTEETIRLRRTPAGYDKRNSENIVQGANLKIGTTSGLLIKLKQHIFLDMGISYVTSGRTRFSDLDSRDLLDPNYNYASVRQPAHSIDLHIGFHFTLPCWNNTTRNYREDRGRRSRRSTRRGSRRKKPRVKSRTPRTKPRSPRSRSKRSFN